jgi:hypothetical protein
MIKSITADQIKAAIAKQGGGELTFEQATAAAVDLYVTATEETDAEHDARVLRQIEQVRGSYRTPQGSGIPGADVAGIANWREQGIARYDSALAQDVAGWERNRALAFGAISAAAAVALGPAATPAAVGAALLPLVGMIQEMSRE